MDASLTSKFRAIDTSSYPDFYKYEIPQGKGLWILLVAKEKLGISRLSAEDISSIARECMEISVDSKSIRNAFCRAKDKIHIYKENHKALFSIMKPGKDYLISGGDEGLVEIFYFESGKPFSNKRLVSKEILSGLKGELKVVDPYCDLKSLDIIREAKAKPIKFLTRIINLRDKKSRFLQQLPDFKKEFPHIEVRDYPSDDIHDRYIISSESVILLGHSIKDLGSKESFAISLNKNSFRNLVDAINENFEKRWKQAQQL